MRLVREHGQAPDSGLIDKRTKLDLVGGYRLVNFAVDLLNGDDIIATDVAMEGPFLGITVTY